MNNNFNAEQLKDKARQLRISILEMLQEAGSGHPGGSLSAIEDTILEAAEKTGAIVTAEEHQLAGGMGSAVLEVLAQNYPVPVKMVGICDRFGESGEPDTLMKVFGLTSDDIATAVKEVLKRK